MQKCRDEILKTNFGQIRVIISLRQLQPRSGTTVLDRILILIMLANNALHTVKPYPEFNLVHYSCKGVCTFYNSNLNTQFTNLHGETLMLRT